MKKKALRIESKNDLIKILFYLKQKILIKNKIYKH